MGVVGGCRGPCVGVLIVLENKREKVGKMSVRKVGENMCAKCIRQIINEYRAGVGHYSKIVACVEFYNFMMVIPYNILGMIKLITFTNIKIFTN